MSAFDKIKLGLEEALAYEQGAIPSKDRNCRAVIKHRTLMERLNSFCRESDEKFAPLDIVSEIDWGADQGAEVLDIFETK